jgi:hypothetical protein
MSGHTLFSGTNRASNEWHSWLIDDWFHRSANRSKRRVFFTQTSENPSKVRPFRWEQYACSSVTCSRERGARVGKWMSRTYVSGPMPDMSCKWRRQFRITWSWPTWSWSSSDKKQFIIPPSRFVGCRMVKRLISWKAVLECFVLISLSISRA